MTKSTTNITHRIKCPNPALACALASFLVAEGHAATWYKSGTGRHTTTVLADAPLSAVNAACDALSFGVR